MSPLNLPRLRHFFDVKGIFKVNVQNENTSLANSVYMINCNYMFFCACLLCLIFFSEGRGSTLGIILSDR